MTMKLGQFRKKKKYGDKTHTHYRFDEEVAKQIHKSDQKSDQKKMTRKK